MDNQEIIKVAKQYADIIKSNLKKIGPWIKETLRLPYAKLYIALSLVLTLLFTLLLFPFENSIRNALLNLPDGKTVLGIEIPSDTTDQKMIEYGLFGSSTFKGITVNINNDRRLKWHELDVNSLISLGGLYSIRFNKQYEGTIKLIRLEYESSKITLQCNLESSFDLSMNKPDEAASPEPQKRPAKRRVKKTATGTVKDGFLNITISNVRLKLKNIEMLSMVSSIIPVPDEFKFNSIVLNSEINNGIIRIKKAILSGKDLSGSIQGSIVLQDIVANSKLDLAVIINKKSSIIADNMDKIQPFIQQLLDPKGNIKIKVNGTLGQPKPDIKMGGVGPLMGEEPKEPPEPVFPSDERPHKRPGKEKPQVK